MVTSNISFSHSELLFMVKLISAISLAVNEGPGSDNSGAVKVIWLFSNRVKQSCRFISALFEGLAVSLVRL